MIVRVFANIFLLALITILSSCANTTGGKFRVLSEPVDSVLPEGKALVFMRIHMPVYRGTVAYQVNGEYYYLGELSQNRLVSRVVDVGILRVSHILFPVENKTLRVDSHEIPIKSGSINYLGDLYIEADTIRNTGKVTVSNKNKYDLDIAKERYPLMFSEAALNNSILSLNSVDFRKGGDSMPDSIPKPDIEKAIIIFYKEGDAGEEMTNIRVDDLPVGNLPSNSYTWMRVLAGATAISASSEYSRFSGCSGIVNLAT